MGENILNCRSRINPIMTQRFILAVIVLIISGTPATAQISSDGADNDFYSLITNMLVQYGNQQYDSALNSFENARKFEDLCTSAEYYYAAACASLLHRSKQAFKYLNVSVQKGWLDTAKLNRNSDFEALRSAKEWDLLMKEIKAGYLRLQTELKGLKSRNPDELIPYTSNDKWGWMDRETGRAVTAAVFAYTGFANAEGLMFTRKDGVYHVLNGRISVSEEEPVDDVDGGAVTALPERQAIGFGATGERMVNKETSDTVAHINAMYSGYGNLSVFADGGLLGLKDTSGQVITGFDAVFEKIGAFRMAEGEMVVITRLPGQAFMEVKNAAGDKLPVGNIVDFAEIMPVSYSNPDDRGRYVAVKTARGWNVLDVKTQSLLWKKEYKSIRGKGGSTFFLVTTADRMFYTDDKGHEYICRPS